MSKYEKALENIVLPKYKKMDLNDPLFKFHIRLQSILRRIFLTPEYAFIGYYNAVGYEIDSLSLMFEKAGLVIVCPAIDSETQNYPVDIIVEAIFDHTPVGLNATGGRAVEEIDLDLDDAAYKVIEYLWKPLVKQDQRQYK